MNDKGCKIINAPFNFTCDIINIALLLVFGVLFFVFPNWFAIKNHVVLASIFLSGAGVLAIILGVVICEGAISIVTVNSQSISYRKKFKSQSILLDEATARIDTMPRSSVFSKCLTVKSNNKQVRIEISKKRARKLLGFVDNNNIRDCLSDYIAGKIQSEHEYGNVKQDEKEFRPNIKTIVCVLLCTILWCVCIGASMMIDTVLETSESEIIYISSVFVLPFICFSVCSAVAVMEKNSSDTIRITDNAFYAVDERKHKIIEIKLELSIINNIKLTSSSKINMDDQTKKERIIVVECKNGDKKFINVRRYTKKQAIAIVNEVRRRMCLS